MVQLDSKTIRQLQLIHLELIKEVDRICKKCGIRYNLVGGTALGAARHGGPIPWDDDADIGFLRSEYEKFRKACETELDTSKFCFQDHRNTDGYRWGYGKLRRKGTVFLREHQEHMPYMQGVFIDVFPFDNIPDNYALRCIHSFKCYCYRKIFWSEVGRVTAVGLSRVVFLLLARIPCDLIYARFDHFVARSNKRDSKMVRILTFPAANREYGYYREWYTDLVEIEYDGIKLPIARDYEGYLSFKYGNYMELPPLEKRKCHPVSELQLLGHAD